MQGIFRPTTIHYLGNRFGETCPAADVPVPMLASLIETVITVIADRCYPIAGMGVEQAAVVNMTDPFAAPGVTSAMRSGVLVEYELDDGVEPSPVLLAALEGMTGLTGEKVAYVVFGGNTAEGIETYNDRWTVGAFLDLDYAMKHGAAEVQKHADRIGSLLY